jgi:cytidylate kinase
MNVLMPDADKRFEAWFEAQRNKKQDPKCKRPTITISRQFGCEAFPLVEKLKRRLDSDSLLPWTIFDENLVEKVSKDQNLSESFLQNLGGPSRYLDILSGFKKDQVTHVEVYQNLIEYIVKIAEAGHAIIVDRGAAVITQDFPNCLHFRLEASFDFRSNSIAERLGISMKEAEGMVNANQELREKFLSEFLSQDVSKSEYYHAVSNNEKISIEEIANIITNMFHEKFKNGELVLAS